jgi:hypothetical protein
LQIVCLQDRQSIFKEHRLQIVNVKSAIFNCCFSDIYIQEEEGEPKIRYIVTSFVRFTIHVLTIHGALRLRFN